MSDGLLKFEPSPIVHGRGLYLHLPLAERLRAARGVPQAVVKVMKKFPHGAKGVSACMDYISREGELPLETESGEVILGRPDRKALVKNWAVDFDQRKDSRDAAHIVFSMPAGSPVEALKAAVRTVGHKVFAGHEWVFAVHTDKKHRHAHMVLKMRGRESNKKIDFKKADLHRLREQFAEAAREQGVELAASSRAARGVGRKGVSQAVFQLRQKGIRPDVDKDAHQEAYRDLIDNNWNPKPWEAAMAQRNKREREANLQEAAELRKAAALKTQQEREQLLRDARLLEQFAQRMPQAKSWRQEVMEKAFAKVLEERKIKFRHHGREEDMER